MNRRQFGILLAADWVQWGGPQRNFHSGTGKLAGSFAVGWRRDLGEGVSGIAVEGGSAYTMYRRQGQEAVVALDAMSGKTLWEFAYDAPFRPENPSAGNGPRAMPQVFGDLLYAVGATGRLHALDKRSGKRMWFRDIYREFRGTEMGYGYSSHPMLFGKSLILMIGGLIALDANSGEVIWRTAQRWKNSNSSPLAIEVDGRPQVVAHMATDLVAIDPHTSDLLWSLPNAMAYGQPILTPVWGPDHLLFTSTAYEGSQMIAVEPRSAHVRWANERFRVYYSTAVRVGDTIYASSGQAGILAALDVHTGKPQWQKRGFPHAHVLAVDGKLLLSDVEGQFSLGTPHPDGFNVEASAKLLQAPSRTPPTLAGNRLFLRDNRQILMVTV